MLRIEGRSTTAEVLTLPFTKCCPQLVGLSHAMTLSVLRCGYLLSPCLAQPYGESSIIALHKIDSSKVFMRYRASARGQLLLLAGSGAWVDVPGPDSYRVDLA